MSTTKLRQIKIFDTTLRDGEQSPGASLNTEEKIQIALALEDLGVDIIEAGFPITSPDDFNAVSQIAKRVKNSIICGLARAVPKDIEAAAEAIKKAKQGRIHTFVSTSEIHLKYQMKKSQAEVLEIAKKSVRLARRLCADVEFSAMDASRTELGYLAQVVRAVIAEGATTINIPDSVGYAIPSEFGNFIAGLIERVPEFSEKNITLSIHCHDDLGLAAANSLAAVQNGATQIECTINGLGERGGNAALEEVVMAMRARKDIFNTRTNINTKKIAKTSYLVSRLTGIVVAPNKAIVGVNAFAHESGIHQDAILKHRETFEIMRAEDIGLAENKLVLGKHSGRAALANHLKKLNLEVKDEELNDIFARFKDLADKKKEIYDEDLLALASDEIQSAHQKYKLELLQVMTGNKVRPSATLALESDNKTEEVSIIAEGTINAIYSAIDKLTNSSHELLEFSMKAITEGKDAQAEVYTRIRKNKKVYSGYGASNDIIIAAAKSYLNAINNSYN